MKLILETEGLEYTLLQGSEEIEVENLVYDSRKDCSNSLFVCMKGSKFDSHQDIDKELDIKVGQIVYKLEALNGTQKIKMTIDANSGNILNERIK